MVTWAHLRCGQPQLAGCGRLIGYGSGGCLDELGTRYIAWSWSGSSVIHQGKVPSRLVSFLPLPKFQLPRHPKHLLRNLLVWTSGKKHTKTPWTSGGMTGCPGKITVILREQKPINPYFIIFYHWPFLFFYHENNLLLYSTYFVSSNKLRSNNNIKRETPGNLRCRIRFDICPLGCRMPRDGPKGRATTAASVSDEWGERGKCPYQWVTGVTTPTGVSITCVFFFFRWCFTDSTMVSHH